MDDVDGRHSPRSRHQAMATNIAPSEKCDRFRTPGFRPQVLVGLLDLMAVGPLGFSSDLWVSFGLPETVPRPHLVLPAKRQGTCPRFCRLGQLYGWRRGSGGAHIVLSFPTLSVPTLVMLPFL